MAKSLSDEDIDRIARRVIELMPPPAPVVIPVAPAYPHPWQPGVPYKTAPSWPRPYEVWCQTGDATRFIDPHV